MAGKLDEGVFLADEINGIIKDSIDEAILTSQFNHDKVLHWTSGVAEVCMKRLTGLAKPFKYIVTCVIMQKNGAGMITATSCYWDRDTDGSRTIRWENKSMYVIVTVFGISM
ncbi:unnamed protein product [Calypogeia fissa]